MNQLTLSLICIFAGLLVSALSSFVFGYYSKRKLSRLEKLRIESLNSLDYLLPRAKAHHPLSRDDLRRIWLDAMNYIMTARSLRAAEVYLDYLKTALGPDAEPFATEARRILADRFGRNDCIVREDDVV